MRLGPLFIALLVPVLGQAQILPSRVSAVTVYPQGAQVRRIAEVQLEAGAVTLRLEGLPSDADESSLRLDVQGPKGTRLLALRFEEAHRPEAQAQRRKDLEKKLRGLDDAKTDLADRVSARDAELELLKSLGAKGGESAGGQRGAAIGAFVNEASKVGERVNVLLTANRRDKRQQRVLDEQIAALNKDLGSGGGESRDMRVAEADLELKEAGRVELALDYQVSNATWTPIYDLELNSEAAKPSARLAFNAELRQSTGEDWIQAQLTLSTARPLASTEIPDPTQWWLDFPSYATPTLQKQSRGRKASAMGAAPMAVRSEANEDDGSAQEQVAVAQDYASTITGEFTTVYKISRPMRVPSDGQAHRVAVAESTHPAQVLLVAVPRLSLTAFIEATIQYQGEQALSPGPLQLFRDGALIGKTQMALVLPQQEFKLGFGQDDAIKVRRERVSDKQGDGSWLSSGKRRYQWLTRLTNLHAGDRVLELREQLPRSRRQEISVELLSIDPKALDEDPDQPGLKRWRLNLKPKQETKIDLRYEVRFPQGRPVQGME